MYGLVVNWHIQRPALIPTITYDLNYTSDLKTNLQIVAVCIISYFVTLTIRAHRSRAGVGNLRPAGHVRPERPFDPTIEINALSLSCEIVIFNLPLNLLSICCIFYLRKCVVPYVILLKSSSTWELWPASPASLAIDFVNIKMAPDRKKDSPSLS